MKTLALSLLFIIGSLTASVAHPDDEMQSMTQQAGLNAGVPQTTLIQYVATSAEEDSEQKTLVRRAEKTYEPTPAPGLTASQRLLLGFTVCGAFVAVAYLALRKHRKKA